MARLIISIIIAIPFLLLGVFIIIGFISNLADDDKRTEMFDSWDKEKYNNYKYTCPMCSSHKVKTIGTVNKAASIATVGLASSKIGKNYQCDDCNYKW